MKKDSGVLIGLLLACFWGICPQAVLAQEVIEALDASVNRELPGVTVAWSVTAEDDVEIYGLAKCTGRLNCKRVELYELLAEIPPAGLDDYEYDDPAVEPGRLYGYWVVAFGPRGCGYGTPGSSCEALDEAKTTILTPPACGTILSGDPVDALPAAFFMLALPIAFARMLRRRMACLSCAR